MPDSSTCFRPLFICLAFWTCKPTQNFPSALLLLRKLALAHLLTLLTNQPQLTLKRHKVQVDSAHIRDVTKGKSFATALERVCGGSSAPYLSLQGHQLHVQLAEEGVGSRGAAGHGHHVLLGQVHAFRGPAARALVVAVLQGMVLPPTQQSHLRTWHHWFHLVRLERRPRGGSISGQLSMVSVLLYRILPAHYATMPVSGGAMRYYHAGNAEPR